MAYAVIDSVAEGDPGKAVWANGVRANQEDHETSIGALEVSDGTQSTRIIDLELFDTTAGTRLTDLETSDGTQNTRIVDLETSDGTQNTRLDTLEAGAANITTFSPNDTTPSVLGGGVFKTDNTSATTITALNDGTAGDVITIVFDDTFTTMDSAFAKTGMEIVMIDGDMMQFIHDGSDWVQTAGTVGVGQFVSLDDPDAIGDWIASTVTAYADVDVSNDGVRKGASSVLINHVYQNNDTGTNLYIRRKGSSTDDSSLTSGLASYNDNQLKANQIKATLNGSAIFEARFTVSWTSVTNDMYVLGYWI